MCSTFVMKRDPSVVVPPRDLGCRAHARAHRALDVTLIFGGRFGPRPMDASAWLAQRVTEARHHAGRHVTDIAIGIGLDVPVVLDIRDRFLRVLSEEANE